jgi:DNA polymerase
MILHLDYETRSLADLPKVGGWRYAFDPSTEILCIGIAEERGDPVVWTPWNHDRNAELLMREMGKPETIIYAHNATGFEVPITDALFEKTTGFKAPQHHQWRCTAAMGRRAALPSSLKRLAEALKLTNQKDDKGGGLIRKFSIPNGKTGMWVEPEEDMEAFQQFCEYCRQDVRVEQEIHQKLKDFELKGFPLQTFLLDLEINSRGFPVNLEALRKAQVIVEKEKPRDFAAFERITGLRPTQIAKFMKWLRERGYAGENLQADTLEEEIDREDFDPESEVGKALLLKKRVSFASLDKIPSMLACAGPHDNKVRGTLNYHGAGTGRWSASLVQPQNFKTPPEYLEKLTESLYFCIDRGEGAEWIETLFSPALEGVSASIRHFIHDVEGGPMLDADYSAIEARALAWQAQEKWRLEVFETHGMIYEASASQMFKVPLQDFMSYRKQTGKHHPLRKKGKVAELALGYRGGPGAMKKMGALKQGLTKEELPGIVAAWREASPQIVRLWNETEQAAIQAVRNPMKKIPFGVRCHFFTAKTAGMDYLFMVLPSGRRIAYPEPKIEKMLTWKVEKKVRLPDGKEDVEVTWKKMLNPTPEQMAVIRRTAPDAKLKDALTFYGQLPKTVNWGRVVTHGGVLVENLCQGVCADFMAHGAINASRAGYEICALIHDEALAYYHPEKGQSLEEFVALLTKLPEWAEGMPLKAEGDVVKFYKK